MSKRVHNRKGGASPEKIRNKLNRERRPAWKYPKPKNGTKP